MYRVIHQGHIVATFASFLDAWLYVYLELDSYARIYGPDVGEGEEPYGTASINPGYHHIN